MKNPLFVLLACLFAVMIGFGITLPVLPFYVERARARSRRVAGLGWEVGCTAFSP